MTEKLTPMMQQYLETKEQYADCILFYRLGDFYEMFFEDAKKVSAELQLTLTGRSCGLKERAPMCGVPFHAADVYIARLVEKGYKVAICEQMEDPAEAKGLVRREVIRIVTPGTVVDQDMLSDESNNYLAALYAGGDGIGLAYCDISTGELVVTSFRSDRTEDDAVDELVRINVKEILLSDTVPPGLDASVRDAVDAYVSQFGKEYFDIDHSERLICRHFSVHSTAGLGLEPGSSVIGALGGLLTYLFETQRSGLEQLVSLKVEDHSGFCIIDKTALRNLELLETLFDKKKEGSLLGVLDHTQTAMGSRMLRRWIREPLIVPERINERLDAVTELTEDYLLRNDVRDQMKSVYDLERLGGRIAGGSANARDLIALKHSVEGLPELRAELEKCESRLLRSIRANISDLQFVHDTIEAAVVEEPPVTIREGGLIREGYSEELDRIKAESADSLSWIANLEGIERERTGIKKLKLGFNKVFGYYLDVPKSSIGMVPEDYIRKQTLVNSERYVTEELKRMETIVLHAETRINNMEYGLFDELRRKLQECLPEIRQTAEALAELDVLACFAEVGSVNNYARPEVDDGDVIQIIAGRHPVIEQSMEENLFISNDLRLDREDNCMLLITGPNMSGKSTYMRQTALIVLMAQIGCFVPAESARIGVVDRIFTRIGASDNLARGQSTFYVEMSELACILNAATGRSLVILDEIGRGTSTYDGLSIAWAVVHYLCGESRMVRTLFATHYHELTELEGRIRGLKNLNVAVSESDGNVVFLHKIEEGGASRSYGIHVARIAGVPEEVLEEAGIVLERLEQDTRKTGADGGTQGEYRPSADTRTEASAGTSRKAAEHTVSEADDGEQISFIQFKDHPVVELIRSLDLMNITPSGAIAVLEQLKEEVKEL